MYVYIYIYHTYVYIYIYISYKGFRLSIRLPLTSAVLRAIATAGAVLAHAFLALWQFRASCYRHCSLRSSSSIKSLLYVFLVGIGLCHLHVIFV